MVVKLVVTTQLVFLLSSSGSSAAAIWFRGLAVHRWACSAMVPRPSEPRPVPTVDDHARRRAARSLRKSSQSLTSSIESELLRAVPLQLVIGACGRLWFNEKVDDYHLSQCVTEIDSFLSHDWGTKPWLKVITLLVYFNSVPAAVASALMCVLVCVLIIFKCVDGWLTCTLAVHGTYWFVFVFW